MKRVLSFRALLHLFSACLLFSKLSVFALSPGFGQAMQFTRGDSNADGIMDISDVLYTLGFLFLGTAEPSCKDAADTNDDGQVNLSDAVFLLNYLFLGAKEIPPPFPNAGNDPTTNDLLDCTGKQGG